MGFELASNPTRHKALSQARDTGQLIATEKVTLVQEQRQQYGTLLFLPVYRKGAGLNTERLRHDNLQGFVLGVYTIPALIEAGFTRLQPSGVDVAVYDGRTPDAAALLYFHASRTRPKNEDGAATPRRGLTRQRYRLSSSTFRSEGAPGRFP